MLIYKKKKIREDKIQFRQNAKTQNTGMTKYKVKQAWEAISSGYSCNLLVCYILAFLLTFVPFLGHLWIGKYPDVEIKSKSSRLICFDFKSLLKKFNFQH